MYSIAIFDGELVNVRELRLEQVASGFFFGCGLFETLLIEQGEPQFLDRHLRRMRRSLSALPAIQAPGSDHLLEAAQIRQALGEALTRCSEVHSTVPAIMKITTSDGHVLVTFRDLSPDHTITLQTGVDIGELDKRAYRCGDVYCNHKTISYLKQYSSMGRGLLFANERDEICESPTANVFAALEDRIVTPPLSAPCLPGIIREILIEKGSIDGRPVVEESLSIEGLMNAGGCILTNSVSIALPVTRFLERQFSESAALSLRVRSVMKGCH
jgi:branched-subunit amino acid aminotransferase/4-amino-4-deoxychorismate lyase